MVLGVAGVAVMTRYLGIESYGNLVTAMAFAGIVIGLADAGLSAIGTRELARHGVDARWLSGNLMGLGLVGWALMTGIALVILPLVYQSEEIQVAGKILLVGAFFYPILRVSNALALASGRTVFVAIGILCGSIAILATISLAVVLDLGFAVVAAATVVGSLTNLLVIGTVVFRWMPAPRFERRRCRELFGELLPMAGVNAAILLYARADVILLSVLSSATAVGIYGLSYKLVDGLVLIPALLMLALQRDIMQSINDPERLRGIVQEAFSLSLQVALPVLVFFVAFREEVAQVLGGGGFEGAGAVLAILIVAVAISYPIGVLGGMLIAIKHQALLLRAVSVGLSVNILGNLIAIPLYDARGAAVTFVLSEMVMLAMVARYYRRFAPLPTFQGVDRLIAPLAAMAAIAFFGATLGPASAILSILTFGLLSVLAYVAGAWRLGVL